MRKCLIGEPRTQHKPNYKEIGLLIAKLLKLIFEGFTSKILAPRVRGVSIFFQYILLDRGMQGENFCRIIFNRFGVSGRQIVGGKRKK